MLWMLHAQEQVGYRPVQPDVVFGRGLEPDDLKFPSNPRHSTIPWFYDECNQSTLYLV